MSGGTWSTADTTSPATRPGAYFNLIAQAISLVDEGFRGRVAIVGRADWGPVDEFQLLTSEEDAGAVFGSGLSLSKLVKQALRGGASEVVALRIAGSTSAEATATLEDGSAAAALTLDAKYPGVRANSFTVTIAANPVSGSDLLLYENGVLIEAHTIESGENQDWVTKINEESGFLTAAVAGAENRVVANVVDEAFTTGDSGGTVVAGDYTAAQDLAEQEDFDAIVFDDDVVTANQDAAVAWAQDRRAGGHYFILVTGSAAADDLTDAQTRAAAIDDEGVVYVFPGFTDNDGVFYSGQEAAARVAGLIAARGVSQSITFARLDDVATVETRLSNEEVRSGLVSGVTLITHDGEVARVEKGINTLTTFTEAKPQSFSKIRTVVTLDEIRGGLERGFKEMIGTVTNDADGQASIIGAGQAFLDTLVQARAIKPGAVLELDPLTPSEGDRMFVKVGLTPLDSIEIVFTNIYISV